MSTIEVILSRMMNESEFSNAVFLDAEKALAEYSLRPEEFAELKSIIPTEVIRQPMELDERKSFSSTGQTIRITFRVGSDSL